LMVCCLRFDSQKNSKYTVRWDSNSLTTGLLVFF
jgi:hypothetical protein